jgi:HTH-type transcriptional regulator/antitoxin HigA
MTLSSNPWISPPSASIRRLMVAKNVQQHELACHLGTTDEMVEELLTDTRMITIEIASILTKHLGGDVSFWMNRDANYRESVLIDSKEDQFLKQVPFAEMVRLGWIQPRRGWTDIDTALNFFGCASVKEWTQYCQSYSSRIAFRQTKRYESSVGPMVSWLRQGEHLAQAIECKTWSREVLNFHVKDLLKLTKRKSPHQFLSDLTRICSDCGVRLVVVPAPKGCRASGATRFLDSASPIIQLSYRYKTDDQFWFTFFHEVGHLLLHSNDTLFIEENENQDNSQIENEANRFAAETLIPPDMRKQLGKPTTNSILRFAKDLGIAPGIVVGQLQFHQKIPFNYFNGLKRIYKWEEINL